MVISEINTYPKDILFSVSTEQEIKKLESDFKGLKDELNIFDVNSILTENAIKEETDKKLQGLKAEIEDKINILKNQINCKDNSWIEEKICKQEKLVKLALISRFI